MTIQKPRGIQLDITSIAIELTTNASALATLDAEYARVDNTNGDGFVNLMSAQSIGGVKTFTSDMVLDDSSGQNPSIAFRRSGTDAGLITGVGNRLLLEFGAADLSIYDNVIVASTSVRGVDDSHATSFTTKSYVDTNFVGLAGTESISGQKTFTDDVSIEGDIVVKSPSGASTGASIYLEERNGFGGHTVGIRTPNSVAASHNIILPDVRGNTGQLLKVTYSNGNDAYLDFVDGNAEYVDLSSGQTIGGAKTFTTNSQLSNTGPFFTINSTQNNAHLQFQQDSV